MAWEKRNGNRYYYRKQWHASRGTCVSQYLGNGSLAEAIADLERLEREQKCLERDLFKAECWEIDEADTQLDELGRLTKAVTGMALIAAGYHQHKRVWRKKRNGSRG